MNQQRLSLNLRVTQKQILTPGLVQMVSVLALNRLELKDMINEEMVANPILEESDAELEGPSIEEIAAGERVAADREVTEALDIQTGEREHDFDAGTKPADGDGHFESSFEAAPAEAVDVPVDGAAPKEKDSFDEIDFGSFFDDYLDPGYRSPASEDIEKPSFENFLSTPTTLTDHLNWQLSLSGAAESVRDAGRSIVGNLDDDGYLKADLAEIASAGGHTQADLDEALALIQQYDPPGVAARDLRECLLIQLRQIGMEGSCVWKVVADHLAQVGAKQLKEIAKALNRSISAIEEAVEFLKRLDPRPGLRYNRVEPRLIEPDVFIVKVGDEYHVRLNEEDMPQLRMNLSYRRLLQRGAADKDVRDYIKDRYNSAMQLIKNIEQRKQTILKVCLSIVARQPEFLDHGIDCLKPMMIKDVAEEVGVHPSTVSRAVASKYAHTPQGVFELRYFFSEAVNGPQGGDTSLVVLKRRVKKMIEEEDAAHPLTDEHITHMLQSQGIQVTRRTVAKYREDLMIPSTHQRRVKA